MTQDDNRKRLADIRDRIAAARARLELKNKFHDAHQATADELQARYELLQSQLADEIQDIEAHGRHVSSLEKSVLDWVNGMEFGR